MQRNLLFIDSSHQHSSGVPLFFSHGRVVVGRQFEHKRFVDWCRDAGACWIGSCACASGGVKSECESEEKCEDA